MRLMYLACALFAGVLAISGCGEESATTDRVADARATLNQLPAGDREAALAQWSCPVCTELLGLYGPPTKRTTKAGDLFFCNEDCASVYEEKPGAYASQLTQ